MGVGTTSPMSSHMRANSSMLNAVVQSSETPLSEALTQSYGPFMWSDPYLQNCLEPFHFSSLPPLVRTSVRLSDPPSLIPPFHPSLDLSLPRILLHPSLSLSPSPSLPFLPPPSQPSPRVRHIAVVGAGCAGLAVSWHLLQAR